VTHNSSREAAPERSPERKPWVAETSVEAPNGAKERFPAGSQALARSQPTTNDERPTTHDHRTTTIHFPNTVHQIFQFQIDTRSC
jgi:hypothetical protein